MLGDMGPIGPIFFSFAREAVGYLTHSPSPADKSCLEVFFRGIQEKEVSVMQLQAGESKLVTVCNHVVIFSRDLKRVLAVEPSLAKAAP